MNLSCLPGTPTIDIAIRDNQLISEIVDELLLVVFCACVVVDVVLRSRTAQARARREDASRSAPHWKQLHNLALSGNHSMVITNHTTPAVNDNYMAR